MSQDQITISLILLVTIGLFLWGRFRHDVVAGIALMGSVVAGLVGAAEAFAGFGHPAVVTVAAVLVLSRGLQTSGAVDVLARAVLPRETGPTLTLLMLMGLGAGLSAFMNNVGAMALLMPIGVQLAGRLGLSPGQVLMPLAFGTILGGMTTLVGTPPNLIVAGFRAETGRDPFGMFDFTPVGLAVAAAGVVFVAVLGWRLVPARNAGGADRFETGAYMTELRVPKASKAAGMTLRELEAALEDGGAQVIGLVRNEVRTTAPRGARRIMAGDILVVEGDVEALADAISVLGLRLEEAGKGGQQEQGADAGSGAAGGRDAPGVDGGRDAPGPADRQEDADRDDRREDDDIVLREYVVRQESRLVGRSASDLLLRTRYGVNLLAVSRDGQRMHERLRSLRIRSGDLLLMQGPAEVLSEFAADADCVPLAERDLRIPDPRRAAVAAAIMLGAVVTAASGLLPAAVAFTLGALASVLLGTVPTRSLYQAIDWPVIVLLAALIPVAGAMQATGTAELLARFLVASVARGNPVLALGLVLVVTMFLSDVMNNAATAAVMCPVAIGIAATLGASPDSFLMAVAIGASCAFLTPIGHQNNTLILGPGGFRFSDYWRLGLPVEIIVVAVSMPLLLLVWPL